MEKRIDSRRGRPWRVSAAVLMGVLALHIAFLSVLSLGASSARRAPSGGQGAAIKVQRASDGTESLVVFFPSDAVHADSDSAAPTLQIRSPSITDIPLTQFTQMPGAVFGLAGEEASSDSAKATATTTIDGAERTVLFGRYVNQVVARIERAWILPHSAPAGESRWGAAAMGKSEASGASSPAFRCRVQVLQSRDGKVLEVTLLDCDASPEWQQSLVNAIDTASPLPAAPTESVFARSLVLNFMSAGRGR